MPNNPLLYRLARATFSLGCFAQCRNWSQVFVALCTSRCTFSHQPTHLRSCIRDGTAIAEASGFRWHNREGVLVLHVEASQKKRLCARVAICSSTPGDYRQNRKCHLFNKWRNACQHRISHQGITVNCACLFHSSLLSHCVEEKNRFLILALFGFGEDFKCEFKMAVFSFDEQQKLLCFFSVSIRLFLEVLEIHYWHAELRKISVRLIGCVCVCMCLN